MTNICENLLTITGECKLWEEDASPSLSELETTILQGSPIGTIRIPICLRCKEKNNPSLQKNCSHFSFEVEEK